MSICEIIDEYLKKYIEKDCDFMEACIGISTHPSLKLIKSSLKESIFELKNNIFSPKLTVYNEDYDTFSRENILKEVSRASKIHIETIKGNSAKREYVEARHAYCLILIELRNKKRVNFSNKEIGDLINRDNSTVLQTKKNRNIPAIVKIINDTKILDRI